MLRRGLHLTWHCSAGALVLLALLLLAGRLLWPLLSDPGRLQHWVSEALGRQVSFSAVHPGWHGLGPALRLDQVSLNADNGGERLRIDQMELRLSLWRSLLQQRLVTTGLRLELQRLALERTATGGWQIRDLPLRDTAFDPLTWLLAQPRVGIRIQRLQILDHRHDGAQLGLRELRLNLDQTRGPARLAVDWQAPGHGRLDAEFRHDGARPRSARLQVQLRRLDSLPLSPWSPLGTQARARLDGSLWLDWRGGGQLELDTDLQLRRLEIAGLGGPGPGLLRDRLALRARLRHADAGHWQLDLRSGPTGLSLRRRNGVFDLAARELYLAPLARGLLDLGLLRREIQRPLAALAPQGRLPALRLRWDPALPDPLQLQASVRELALSPWGPVPGLSGLDLQAQGGLQRARLQLDMDAARNPASLHLAALFRGPWPVRRLHGALHWRNDPQGWALQAPALRLDTEDLTSISRFRLHRGPGPGAPELALLARLERGDAAALGRYLPAAIMPGAALRWLDRGIVSGRIRDAGVVIQGPLQDFPFDQGSGRMAVQAETEDIILDYLDAWHRIEELAASLRFVNRSMHIHGVSGRILGTEIHDIDARIADLDHAVLELDGHANGELADLLRFVVESPLQRRFGPQLGALEAQGAAALRLDLRTDLDDTATPLTLQGRVRLDGNRLDLPDWDLSLAALRGELGFDQDGVHVDGLQARLFGQPARIHVQPGAAANDQPAHTRIEIATRLTRSPLLDRHLGHYARYLRGASPLQLGLRIPAPAADGSPRPLTLDLHSDLQGLALDLPAPLGKPAVARAPLTLQLRLRPGQAEGLQLNYAGLLDARLGYRDGRLTGGDIRLGGAPAAPPGQDRLRLSGQLPALDLGAWVDWLDSLPAAPGEARPAPLEVDLGLGRLQWHTLDLGALHLALAQGPRHWQAELDGERLQGRIDWPYQPASRALIDLQRLWLPAPGNASDDPDVVGSTPAPGPDPSRLPPLQLQITDLRLGDLTLGQLQGTASGIPDGLHFQPLALRGDGLEIDAQLDWRQGDAAPHTRLSLARVEGELGSLLGGLGQPDTLEGGPYRANAELAWPGPPHTPQLAGLTGDLELDIGKGRLLELEPGAGRILGLLSLQSLPRRLTLDFSDLFGKGFAFDRIQGRFRIANGNALTDDLAIDTPGAHLEIRGRTGLLDRDYDQQVRVRLRLHSSLPLAGAIAGGPVVGATLLLLDQLFGEELEDRLGLTQVHYRISGPWEDPRVERVPAPPAPAGLPGAVLDSGG